MVNDEAVTKEDANLDDYGMVPGARANRLGDALSSVGSDGGRDADDDDDIDRAERADRSIQGSVY
ncbi:uncharacterized protein VDAG_09993 [Verticillium dahliae VdLs.17]|uniref:Uncharacterized protein n=2 Tax=Verticillium dahliae TaxID=27337 RepID=G2XIL1_VERDV|nr:uncharacterized protein VDAG_09993 [Verticillium dahliae VdLs.17]EGY20364.1 hypothetical protein VDAG_09993 [Verticillium dahliae VdLs.17]